jgi:hypothetical protein
MSSNAEVVMIGVCHGPCMKAVDMGHTKTSDAAAAEASQVSSTKAADVAAAKAAHAAAPVPSASAAAASGLGTRGKQAPGQYCAD